MLNLFNEFTALGGLLNNGLSLRSSLHSKPSHKDKDELTAFGTTDYRVIRNETDLKKYAEHYDFGGKIEDYFRELLAVNSTRGKQKQIPLMRGVGFTVAPMNKKGANSLATETVPRNLLLCGLLSRIVVHSDKTGIRGIEQYFGATPYFMGTRGNFTETSFPISFNDPLVRIIAAYRTDDSKLLTAVRFFTASGEDSDWIGTVQMEDASVWASTMEYQVPVKNSLRTYPIFALDSILTNKDKEGWKPGYIHGLTARHCDPFSVEIKIAKKHTVKRAADGDYGKHEIDYDYENKTDTAQTITLDHIASVVNSHTVTNQTENSVSESFSMSLSAQILAEGVFLSGNASHTSSQTLTTSHTDSYSITNSEQKNLSFPIVVPAGKRVSATLLTSSDTTQATATHRRGIQNLEGRRKSRRIRRDPDRRKHDPQ